jgi:hypothetical protein
MSIRQAPASQQKFEEVFVPKRFVIAVALHGFVARQLRMRERNSFLTRIEKF